MKANCEQKKPKSEKKRYVSVKEFNEKLKECNSLGRWFVDSRDKMKGSGGSFSSAYALLEDKMVAVELTYRKNGSDICTYIMRKDAENENYVREEDVAGGKGYIAFDTLGHYYKDIPRCKEEDFYINGDIKLFRYGSATPILDYNPKYEGKRIRAVSYDLNSAYSNAMVYAWYPVEADPIRTCDFIGEGEMGFVEGKWGLTAIYEGFATWIFHKQPAPAGFKEFVKVWYNRKKNAKNKKEKCHAKNILNHCIGYLQRVNPWWRAAIISYANKLIEDLIWEYADRFVQCNTDSITFIEGTIVPEIEKNIGKELGQWKKEHEDELAFVGFNYQWGLDIPTYRGIPKKWFAEGWDILKHELPTGVSNHYYLDREELVVKERKIFGRLGPIENKERPLILEKKYQYWEEEIYEDQF